MRELDRRATEEFGIPSLRLMENAGRGTAEIILKKFPKAQTILIFCGKGNNGGDGFVIARYLYEKKKEVLLALLAEPSELKGDALKNWHALPPGVTVSLKFSPELFQKADLAVDAILGIGIKSGIVGDLRTVIEAINHSGKPVVAVDLPSGLDADTGEVRGAAIKAGLTATMAFQKTGMLQKQGPLYCGEIHIVDIGLPRLDTPRGF